MRSQVSQQRESADERVDTSELQAHPGLPYWRFSCQIAQIWRFFEAFGMKILVWHFGIFLAILFQSGNSVTHCHIPIAIWQLWRKQHK